jgi:hypothetical protein
VYGPRNDCIDYTLEEDKTPIPNTAQIEQLIEEVFQPKKTVFELYKMTSYEQMKVYNSNSSTIMIANNSTKPSYYTNSLQRRNIKMNI